MLTVKCDRCGKEIHMGFGYQTSCMYCGSTVNQTITTENNCYSNLVEKCESKISSCDFSGAITEYDRLINLFPDKSRLYWGRMLARKSVADDLSLILKGVCLAEDSDFVLALHFADEAESSCLSAMTKTRENIVNDLLALLNRKEKEDILAKGLETKQKSLEVRIHSLRDELRGAILKLDEAEKKIRNALVDGNVLIDSEKKRINEYVSKIEKIKNEIQTKTEVTLEEMTSCKEDSSRFLAVCNKEWQTISARSNCEAFSKFKNAQEEQKKSESEIYAIMRQIDQVKDELNHIVITVTAIKNKYKLAKSDIENGSFARAKQIIGENNFTSLVQRYLKAAK